MSLSGLIRAYEQFILQNSQNVGYIETLLQMGYNLTPARFGNGEVTTEGVYSAISLLTLYHDIILWKHKQKLIKEQTSFSAHQKKLLPRWWQLCAILLSSMSATEVFVEIYYREKNKRWRAILFFEMFRAFIRLIMLYKSGGAMLVRQRVPAKDTVTTHEEEDMSNMVLHRETMMDWVRQSSPDAGGKSWTSYWISQLNAPRQAIYIPSFPTAQRTLGEILYILRPVIYVYFLMKFGRKAWIPWIISLVIDLLSNKLSKGQKKTNTDEAEELTRRKLLWIFYLIRPPFFEKIICAISKQLTPNCIQKRTKSLSSMVKGYRDVYFYTAGSA